MFEIATILALRTERWILFRTEAPTLASVGKCYCWLVGENAGGGTLSRGPGRGIAALAAGAALASLRLESSEAYVYSENTVLLG